MLINTTHLRLWACTAILLLLLVDLLQQLLHCGHLIRVKVPRCLWVNGHAHLACLGVHTEGGLQRTQAKQAAMLSNMLCSGASQSLAATDYACLALKGNEVAGRSSILFTSCTCCQNPVKVL
jgi:hypothetical protein